VVLDEEIGVEFGTEVGGTKGNVANGRL